MASRVYLITVQANDGTNVQTLRFSTDGVMTTAASHLPNTYFEPRVVDAGNFERHLFSEGQIRGQSQVGSGDVVLASANVNGTTSPDDTLDYMLPWFFDGRQIIIQSLADQQTDISDAETMFTGTIEQLISTDAYSKLSIKLHDALTDLEQPLLQNTYSGTTTGGGGGDVAGNSELTGVKKQKVYGQVFNAPAQAANPFDLVYQFSDGAINGVVVYDGGAQLVYDGDQGSLSGLFSWTQVAGHYATYLAGGYVRLGSSPVFQITGDVNFGTNLLPAILGFENDAPHGGFATLATSSSVDTKTFVLEANSTGTHTAGYVLSKSTVQKTYRFSGKFAIYFTNTGLNRHVEIVFGDFSTGSNFAAIYYNLLTGDLISVTAGVGGFAITSYPLSMTDTGNISDDGFNPIFSVELEFTTSVANNLWVQANILNHAGNSPDASSYLGDGGSAIQVSDWQLSELATFTAASIVQDMLEDFYGVTGDELILSSPDQWVKTNSTLITGTVFQFKEDTSSGQHWISQTFIKANRRVVYRFSADFLANGRFVVIQFINFSGSSGFRLPIDLTAGALAITEDNWGAMQINSFAITSAGSGYFNVTVDFASDTEPVFSLELFSLVISPLNTDYTGDGASGFFYKNASMKIIAPIDEDTFTALDVKNSASCGILVSGDITTIQAAQQVLDSIGGYLVPNQIGLFGVGRFEAPASPSTSILTIDESIIVGSDIQRIGIGEGGRGLTTWLLTFKYAKNWTIQDASQLAGTVGAVQRAVLSQDGYSVIVQDQTIKDKSILALQTTLDSCLVDFDDATNEAARLFAIYSTKREAYRVTTWLDYTSDAELGTVVTLQSPRFGLSAGKDFVVIGRVDNYLDNTLQLDLWG
jgi:hypothetical protein